jgi:hypothetical protein
MYFSLFDVLQDVGESFTTEERTPVPIVWEVGWAPESVWTQMTHNF